MSLGERRPRFVVLLAAFNGKQWLNQQLESILQQRDVDVTVYVSVDKSDDGTEALIDRIERGDARVRSLPHGRVFGGAAANFIRLIDEAPIDSFDFIALSDQDDLWYPDKLIRAVRAIRTEDVACYSSNVTAFWADGKSRLIDKSAAQRNWDYLFEAAGPGCTYVLNPEVAISFRDRVRSMRDQAALVELHDWLIYAFARANGFRWFIDPQPSLGYRQHASNQVGVNLGFSAFARRARKIMTGWGMYQAEIVARIAGPSASDFVQRHVATGRFGFLRLAVHAGSCRRCRTDQFIFAFACLAMAIFHVRRR